MAYRLGVDVAGTFTDLLLASVGNGGAQYDIDLKYGDVVSLDECLTGLGGLVGTHAR